MYLPLVEPSIDRFAILAEQYLKDLHRRFPVMHAARALASRIARKSDFILQDAHKRGHKRAAYAAVIFDLVFKTMAAGF